MPKAPRELPPPIGTRSSNTESRPARDRVEVTKRKRRTKAEMAADEAEKKRKKEEQELKKADGVNRIAEIENSVAQQDTNLVTPKPRPKPRPLKRPVRHTSEDNRPIEVPTDGPEVSEYEPVSTKEDDSQSNADSDTGDDSELTSIDESPVKKKRRGSTKAQTHQKTKAKEPEPSESEPESLTEPPPKKKKEKASVRETIKQARQNAAEEKRGERADFDGLSDVERPHGKSVPKG